jgi:hypothetical protein
MTTLPPSVSTQKINMHMDDNGPTLVPRNINFLGTKVGPLHMDDNHHLWVPRKLICIWMTTLPPSVSRLSAQCEIVNNSQPYRPPRPVAFYMFRDRNVHPSPHTHTHRADVGHGYYSPAGSFHRLIDRFVFATARPLSAAMHIITLYQHTNWNLYWTIRVL